MNQCLEIELLANSQREGGGDVPVFVQLEKQTQLNSELFDPNSASLRLGFKYAASIGPVK